MLERKLQVSVHRLLHRPRAAEGREETAPRLQPQCAQNVVAMAVAFVHRRCRRARRLGDGTHGERLLAAARPQPRGRLKNALFEFRIGMPGQCSSYAWKLWLEIRCRFHTLWQSQNEPT